MKINYIITIVLSMLMTGCSLIEIFFYEEVLEFSQNEFAVPSEGGEFVVSVTYSGNYALNVKAEDASWVQTTISSGAGSEDFVLRLYIEENKGYDSRHTRVEISASPEMKKYIDVFQTQKDAIVTGSSDIMVESNSGTFVLALGSNVEYDMSISDEWLSLVQTKSFVEKELEFAYEENNTYYEREALITFSYKNIKQEVKVVQAAANREYVLRITHFSESFVVPEFTGFMQSGYVDWGDGIREVYSEGLSHEYGSSSEVIMEIKFDAPLGEHVVKLDKIKDLVEIDLTGM